MGVKEYKIRTDGSQDREYPKNVMALTVKVNFIRVFGQNTWMPDVDQGEVLESTKGSC